MPLGQLAADEETEPGAGLGPNCRIVNPEEALEDLFVLVSRDADAMVLEDERRAFVEADGQVDPWLPGGIGQGVVEQVVDDARQLFTVGVDPDRLVWLVVEHLGFQEPRSRLGSSHRQAGHLAQVEHLGVGRHRASFDPGGGQQVIDDAVQLGGLADQNPERPLRVVGRDGAVLQHREVTGDDGKRGAEFVGGHAEEGALALARLLRLGEEDLRLLQQLFGAHVRLDGVEDDPGPVGELVEEVEMGGAEWLHRGQFDHRLDAALEQDRQDDDGGRRRLAQPRANRQVPGGDGGQHDPPAVAGALSDQPFAPAEALVGSVAVGDRIPGGDPQRRLLALVSLDDVEGPVMGGDERRHLGQDQVGDRVQVALALEHLGVLGDVGLEPVLLGVLLGRLFEVADHLVDLVGEQCDLALGLHPNRPGQVALGYRRCHFGDRPNLGGQVGGQPIDVIGEVLPGAGGAGYAGLAAQLALDADFAGHGRDLLGEGGQGVGHLVDGVGQSGDLALGLEHDFAPQVAVGDRGHDPGDAAHLVGEVAGHQVDAVGEVLPGSGDALDLGLAAQLAFRPNLASHPGDFRGKGVQLVDHDVDRVLELEDFTPYFDRDLLRQVAPLDRGGDLGDVAHLGGEVGGELVDVIGEVAPGAGGAQHVGLATQAALGADFAGHPRDLADKGIQLIDHDVDGVLQLEDLTLDGGRDLGDVAHLGGEVAGHRVDVVGQVLPGAGGGRDVGLAAQPALGADLARHPADLAGEGVELIDHDVDGVLQLEDLTLDLDRDLLGEVAALHRGGDLGDVAHLGGEVAGQLVDLLGQVFPGSRGARHTGLAAQLTFGTDFARHPGDLGGEGVELADHGVDRLFQLTDLAVHIDGDLFREITFGDGGRHLGDVAHLGGEVAGHVVDVVGEVFPHARHALHLRLAAQLALGTDFAGHPGDLAGEGVQLVDHGVDRVFELEDLALDLDGDLLGEVAFLDRRGDLGDVAHLGGQVAGHEVHALGQVLPDAADAADLRLAAQLAFGADLARYPGDFGGTGAQLVDYRVDRGLQPVDLALYGERVPLSECA